jgi:hypothetical protein
LSSQAIEQQIESITAQTKRQLERGAEINDEEIPEQVCSSTETPKKNKKTPYIHFIYIHIYQVLLVVVSHFYAQSYPLSQGKKLPFDKCMIGRDGKSIVCIQLSSVRSFSM